MNQGFDKLKPYEIGLIAGKTYYWCSCGLSSNQPFCDGSHKGITAKKSVAWQAEATENKLLCGCTKTKNPPYCDESHHKI